MRRITLLAVVLLACWELNAQWVNNPANNTFIANCNSSAAEVYVATDPISGDTYVQWHYQGENGWSPWVQRLNAEGVPQWPAEGIHITTPDFATWSPGYAMTAVEGGVATVFRTLGPHHWAVKINADGSLPWGEHGIVLFNGEGGGRSEILAGDDGGIWALGTDMDSTFLQYVNPNGTLRASVTINDPAKKCTNGILVPAENGVFVVYAKQTLQGWTNYQKEIYVAGYDKDGGQIVPETLLLGLQTVGASYVHYAISDGNGGGYVYQWHNGIGGVYNTYVTHFNANGAPTIMDTNGVTVHSHDASHYYTNAYATVDPVSHDLILAYRQTDSDVQVQDMVMMNRITAIGEKPWEEGIEVTDAIGDYSDIKVDAYEYGEGFTVIYSIGDNALKAVGYDMEGTEQWNTTMTSSNAAKAFSENSSGFHLGQNIVAWVNSSSGGVYGQNIGWDGTMGEVTPPTPPAPCDPPTDFYGFYAFDSQCQWYGVELYWTAPERVPHHYNLYREDLKEVIEIDADQTSYIEELPAGDYIFRLTAVYDECESDYALTADGEDYLLITVTSVAELSTEEIVNVTKIYTLGGQLLRNTNLEELGRGVYIVQGYTKDGKLVTRKQLVNY